MMAAAAAAAVASASPGLVPPLPGQKVLSVRHYEAGPPLPEEGEAALAKNKDANSKTVPGSEATGEPLEEEWVTRKRVELTTTRQTETRVKRQVELDEEGRVVGDSGPIVTTNTTEDTHSEEQKHTEHRAVGPEDEPLPPLEGPSAITSNGTKALAEDASGGVVVREVRERKIKSREEKEEVCETEDVVHLGDITDEGYLAAVRENKDVRTTAAVETKALAPEGPRVVRQTARGRKVVDTEDTEEASLAAPDGRLLTETKTQHQHVVEDMEEDDDEEGKDLPDEQLEGEGKSHKFVRTKEEEIVSYLSNGVKIGEEMRYRAEGFEGEKEAADETDAPPRLRALKPRLGRGVHPPSPGGGERKDALTKRPLDLDAEEETRKVETSKWLEHHFGSDSRSSREGSAGGFDDPESPFYGGVTQGGGSYIGITMKSKTNNIPGKDPVTPTDIREPLRASPLPSPIKSNGVVNGYNRVKTPEPLTPPPMPTANGYHHHHTETEVTRTTRTSSGSGGQGIIGRKDVIQVLPTGPGRTFRPPRGAAVPPPSTTELAHVEPQKRKKRPPPQPSWTPEANGEEDERLEGRNSRPWSAEENGRRGSGSHGEDLIGRNMSPNFLSGPKPYRSSTLSSPSDHSWNNRTEEATISWANGVTEQRHVVVTTEESHHHHHHGSSHLASPNSALPDPPPQEGVRVARTRRKAPPIPGAAVDTDGAAQDPHVSTSPAMSPLEKKQSQQKTRFADEEEDEDEEEEVIDVGKEERPKKADKKAKKKKSGSFGDSIRRLVGRLRSRSSEKKKGKEEQGGKQNGHHQPQQNQQKAMTNGNARRGSWRSSSRSPSPDEYGEPTYRRYQNAIDGNIRPSSVKRQQEERHQRGDLNGRHHGRSVGVHRRESSPNEATSEEEEFYEEEVAADGVDGREGVGIVVGGPVAPPRSRPATSYQGHLPMTQQHRGLQAESSGGGGSYRHQQHAYGHHHVVSGRGRQKQQHLQASSSSTRRATSPGNRQSNETSSRGDTDRSWKGSALRGRRDYGAEIASSSGGGSSSRRRNSAYSPERGNDVPFSSTNSEGEVGRRREADRVPPLLATSTPMDYDKKHHSYTARRDEAGNHVQRFYLGEDPFGGSIYGREREYEGVKRSSRQRGHGDEQRRSGVRYGATLGRPSGSNTNHSSSYHSHTETTRAQTLPRKLRHSPPHYASNHVSTTTSSVRRQLYADTPGTNSISKSRDLQRHTGSLINVSIVNNVTPGTTNSRAPPAKPARTYRSNLSRSKSFNVHGNQGDEVDSALPRHTRLINGDRWESPASRYRSNPQLSRILHEESPLKSPGIISSINRSQRDLRDAVREESNTKFAEMIRKEESGLLKKKEWTPMNFKERNGIISGGITGDTSGGSGGRSESVRITTVSDGPSMTRTVKNFEKRTSGGGDGINGKGRVESSYETTTTVTESRTRAPTIWNRGRKSVLGPNFSETTGNGGVVIEVRNGRL